MTNILAYMGTELRNSKIDLEYREYLEGRFQLIMSPPHSSLAGTPSELILNDRPKSEMPIRNDEARGKGEESPSIETEEKSAR